MKFSEWDNTQAKKEGWHLIVRENKFDVRRIDSSTFVDNNEIVKWLYFKGRIDSSSYHYTAWLHIGNIVAPETPAHISKEKFNALIPGIYEVEWMNKNGVNTYTFAAIGRDNLTNALWFAPTTWYVPYNSNMVSDNQLWQHIKSIKKIL